MTHTLIKTESMIKPVQYSAGESLTNCACIIISIQITQCSYTDSVSLGGAYFVLNAAFKIYVGHFPKHHELALKKPNKNKLLYAKIKIFI